MLSTGAALGPDDPVNVAFREGMRDEGFVEGIDYEIVARYAASDPDVLIRSAQELVGLGVEVILASSTGTTQAARAATSKVPIVMVASHDPLEAGVCTDLARPGGNVTGQSLAGSTAMPKQLEYLAQIAPVRRIGYLSPSLPSYGPGYPSVTDTFERSMRRAAAAVGIEVVAPKIPTPSAVSSALTTLASQSVDSLFMIESPTWFTPGTSRPINDVVDFAFRRRLPTMGGHRKYAEQGLLASYGDVRLVPDLYRGVSRYVAKILRGAAPGDLAIEQPTFFELVLNAKTAAALSLEVPRFVIDRAAYVFR